jgi:hypothetical protein
MYEREMPCEANLLSAFALMIGGALGTGLPVSDNLALFLNAFQRSKAAESRLRASD